VTFIPESDPRIRALASQAAREIKALTHAHNQQIEGIYRRFLDQSAAIKEENQCSLTQPTITEGQDDETNADRLDSSSAGFSPKSTQ
jgi:hypothetical protein